MMINSSLNKSRDMKTCDSIFKLYDERVSYDNVLAEKKTFIYSTIKK